MYYENFQRLCEKKGVKPRTVSEATGVSTATLSSWKTGKYTPKPDKLIKIANYFDVPLSEIMSGVDVRDITAPIEVKKKMNYDIFTGTGGLNISRKIPVLGRVAAGIPITATENIVDWEEISGEMALDGEYFALQIKGDSMEPRICSGDVVIVRQQPDADSGDTVIALINGDDAVCKKLKKYEDGSIALISNNPAYTPLFFSVSDAENVPVSILGKVAELRGKL